MIKQILIGFLVVFNLGFGYSQDKWLTSAQVDFIFPNKSSYLYSYVRDSDSRIVNTDDDISYDGFLLRSFAVQADYNYMLFQKLSIGVLGGFHTQLSDPGYSFFKLGGVLKYYFVDSDNVYIYLHDAHGFTLNTEKLPFGNNARAGIAFPFMQKDKFNVLLNFFVEQNFFDLRDGLPLYNNEMPSSLSIKSIGISFGVQF